MNIQPEIRISDSEREAAASTLGEHFAEGRLTKEEYDERSAQAWSATINSDLWPLFADLPSSHEPHRAVAAQPRPQQPWRQRRSPWFGLPMLPVLLVIVGLVVLTHVPWPLFILLGWLWFTGFFRRGWFRRRW